MKLLSNLKKLLLISQIAIVVMGVVVYHFSIKVGLSWWFFSLIYGFTMGIASYEEDDYDEYFDEDGRVSTSSPSGCTYHKDLKFFIKNDLGRIIAQAQQEAVSAERERIKQIVIKMQDRATEEECWRALKELEETPQKEQEQPAMKG